MMTNDARFREEAFGEATSGSAPIMLQSQQNAVNHLRSILTDRRAARLIYGPESSGKSTIVRKFIEELPDEVANAVVDGTRLSPRELLAEILAQFGYRLELRSPDELLRMLNVFAVQQTRACQAPLVVVENIERMYPNVLRVLCMLASFRFQGRFALRIILTGNQQAAGLLRSEGMTPISQRTVAVYQVEPLWPSEAMRYLQGRLNSSGVRRPDEVLPVDVCEKLHEISAGLPGVLRENAKGTLALAKKLPVCVADVEAQRKAAEEEKVRLAAVRASNPRRVAPRLILTSHGETLQDIEIKEKKIVVGRSSLADIVIHNEYASKMHALFMLYSDALVLFDLNSANGTFVNSVQVNSTILRHDDIISIASHRIKVVDVPDAEFGQDREVKAVDTAKMKALDERREEKKKTLPFFDVDREKGS